MAVQSFRLHAQPLEVIQKVRFDALQPRLCSFQAVRLHAEGQVLGLDKPVVAPCKLVLEHFGVFGAYGVKLVPLRRDDDVPCVAVAGGGAVDKGELEFHGAVEVVEEIAPCVEDGGLVLVLVELVVDVLKLDGFRVVAVRHAANAVGEHPLERDAVLCGLAFLILPLRFRYGGLDLSPFGAGELGAGGQCDTPPGLICPAVPIRRRNCRSRRGAAWGAGSTPARCFG